MPHTSRTWRKPQPQISDIMRKESKTRKTVPVMFPETIDDLRRLEFVRRWHQERMNKKDENFERHQQIHQLCARRIDTNGED